MYNFALTWVLLVIAQISVLKALTIWKFSKIAGMDDIFIGAFMLINNFLFVIFSLIGRSWTGYFSYKSIGKSWTSWRWTPWLGEKIQNAMLLQIRPWWTLGVHWLQQIFSLLALNQTWIKISAWNFQHLFISCVRKFGKKILAVAQSACQS